MCYFVGYDCGYDAGFKRARGIYRAALTPWPRNGREA